MFLSFFQNACILIASLSIIHHFIKDRKISRDMPLKSKVLWGLYNGILGIILMINSAPTTSETFIDFRYIPILFSALYSGFLSSIVSSILIGIFRFLILGISNTSVIGLIIALFIGIGFGIISLLKLSRRNQYVYCMLFFIVLSVASAFVVPVPQNPAVFFQTMILYYSGYLIVSYLSIKYADYILEIIKIYQRLKNEATKDYLTGLNNVRQFDNSFNSISQMAIRKEEEFSIILLDCSESKAVKIAERLRKNVENNNFYISDNESIKITISIGISSYPKLTSQIDNLLENADIALYQAKNNGRNKVVVFNNEKNNI